MEITASIAKDIASTLLDIEAIKLSPEAPFTWASGWKSPIYCDNRMLLSFPAAREKVALTMSQFIKEKYPNEELDIYISDNRIDIDSESDKYGTILDKISESDIAYFSKDYTKDILSQLEYQYCKDLGIGIVIE